MEVSLAELGETALLGDGACAQAVKPSAMNKAESRWTDIGGVLLRMPEAEYKPNRQTSADTRRDVQLQHPCARKNADSEDVTRQVRIGGQLAQLGYKPISTEGYESANWILMDYGDFVIHIFSEDSRSFYDLERLWGMAPSIPIPAEVATAN